jgi:hypothetical protein
MDWTGMAQMGMVWQAWRVVARLGVAKQAWLG